MSPLSLRVYDLAHRTPHWNDRLAAGQVAVFFSDVHTGAPLTAAGKRVAPGEPPSCTIFDTLDQATDFCRQATGKAVRLRCEIFDARGRTDPPLAEVISDSHHRRSQAAIPLLYAAAAVMLAASVTLFWQEHRRNLHGLFIFLGLNCVVISARLFLWGRGLRDIPRRS